MDGANYSTACRAVKQSLYREPPWAFNVTLWFTTKNDKRSVLVCRVSDWKKYVRLYIKGKLNHEVKTLGFQRYRFCTQRHCEQTAFLSLPQFPNNVDTEGSIPPPVCIPSPAQSKWGCRALLLPLLCMCPSLFWKHWQKGCLTLLGKVQKGAKPCWVWSKNSSQQTKTSVK